MLAVVPDTRDCCVGQAALEGATSQLRTLQADAHEKCAPASHQHALICIIRQIAKHSLA